MLGKSGMMYGVELCGSDGEWQETDKIHGIFHNKT
jgi:hypothetical protein